MAESSNIIKLPDGSTVEATQSNLAPVPQKIRLLGAKEVLAIKSASKQSILFVQHYLTQVKNPSLKDYDLAIQAWRKSDDNKFSSEQVIEFIGSYLGEKSVMELDMEWIEVTDHYGTDKATRGKHADITSFPFSAVSKRIEDNEDEFVYSLFHSIEQLSKESSTKNR